MNDVRKNAERMLDRIELRYGYDLTMRNRLRPLVVRVLESSPASTERTALLRLVVKAYANHIRVKETLDELRVKLRERLNEVYGEILGIEPPRLAS